MPAMPNELPILPPNDVTTQQLYVLIAQLNAQVREQREEISELRATVKDMADAWKAASTLVSFVKLVGALAAAIAAMWGAVRIMKGVG